MSTWVSNASPPTPSPAVCDFGHGYSSRTWPTTAWVDSVSRLLSVYEVATEDDADDVAIAIQQDWAIFDLEPKLARDFLGSSLPSGHEFLSPDARVRLRSRSDGRTTDHIRSWEEFSHDIRFANRYFPNSSPDTSILRTILDSATVELDLDVEMYRARVFQAVAPRFDEMGAPPPEVAGAGRANPVGIAHLYLAFDEETCIYETRPANQSQIAIGKFSPVRKLRVVNLADIEPPDFFSVLDIDSTDDHIARVESYRYMRALGSELTRPVRSSDQQIDYIPTQYLCELIKNEGFDGVLYSSSLNTSGRNLVLFDTTSAVCSEPPHIIQVTSLKAEWTTM